MNCTHNEYSEADEWETVSEPGDNNTLQNHIMPYTQHEHKSMRKPCLHGLKYTEQEDKMLKEWALQKEFPGQILMNQWRVFVMTGSPQGPNHRIWTQPGRLGPSVTRELLCSEVDGGCQGLY